MTTNVLVPLDGSPLSFEALRHALRASPDASITALHVIDLFEPAYGEGTEFETTYEPPMGSEEWREGVESVAARILEEAESVAADHDRELATVSEIGDPKRVIVDYAEQEDVDHVVIGAHGRTNERRPIFGVVAETVARRSPVTVTLVR